LQRRLEENERGEEECEKEREKMKREKKLLEKSSLFLFFLFPNFFVYRALISLGAKLFFPWCPTISLNSDDMRLNQRLH
jgi:hypothetical protein